MSYKTISKAANDESLAQRGKAAYAKEGHVEQPDAAWYAMRWAIAADPSIEPPYASAVAANNPDPGGDESVITDGMLLAAVTAHPYTPPPGP